jgi:ATP-binding protein involved in chromosome partitioning
MSGISEAAVLEALKTVKDPGKGQDIVGLGMISGLIVKDGNVGFAIEVDPRQGAAMEPLRKAAEKAVHDLPGVTSVTAVLTAERAPQGVGGGQAARRRHLRPLGIPRMLGLTGKRPSHPDGKKVGILDADI